MNQQNTASGWQQIHTHILYGSFIWNVNLNLVMGMQMLVGFFLLLFLSFFAIAVNDDFVN